MIHATRVFRDHFGANGDDVRISTTPRPVPGIRQTPGLTPPPTVPTSAVDQIRDTICLLRLQGRSEAEIQDVILGRFAQAGAAAISAAIDAANVVCPPPAVTLPPPGTITPATPGTGGALKPFLIVGGILVGILGIALIAAKTGKKSAAAA